MTLKMYSVLDGAFRMTWPLQVTVLRPWQNSCIDLSKCNALCIANKVKLKTVSNQCFVLHIIYNFALINLIN